MAQKSKDPASAAAPTGSGTILNSGKASDPTNSRHASILQAKPRGGRRSRQKGDRFERAIVRLLQAAGLGAERRPLSGSAGGGGRDHHGQ